MQAAIILGLLGLILGLILAWASKIFHVEKDARIEKIEKVLPQANCGACGYPGCSGFAEAVATGKAPINGCVPGGDEVAEKIAEILGTKAEKGAKKVAIVHCNGNINEMKKKYEYKGIKDCNAAVMLLGGDLSCDYGCLGFYSCVEACPFDAMYIGEHGVPRVDEDKCTGCGVCIETCPKNIIGYKEYGKEVDVLCSSHDKGGDVMKVCKDGCIGCKKCEKVCPTDAIKVDGFLASIDYEKCISCGQCAEVCPTHAIEDKLLLKTNIEKREKPEIVPEKCIGCTICAKNCPVNAINGEVKKVHEIDKDKCIACGICVEKCPKDAIDWALKDVRKK